MQKIKNQFFFPIIIFLCFCFMPSLKAFTLTETDLARNINCIYGNPRQDYINVEIRTVMNEYGTYSIEIGGVKVKSAYGATIYNKTAIANWTKNPLSSTSDLAFEKTILKTKIEENLKRATESNDYRQICPITAVYATYRHTNWLGNSDKKEVWLFSSPNEYQAFQKYLENNKNKNIELKKYDLFSGAVINNNADKKKLEVAKTMEKLQEEKQQYEKKLEENPNDKEAQQKVDEIKEKMEELQAEYQVLDQATQDQRTEFTDESQEAEKIYKKIVSVNPNLNFKIDIVSGCDLISGDLAKWLVDFLKYLRLGVIILTIALTIKDFLKTIVTNDDKGLKGAWNHLIKRLVVLGFFLLLPIIVENVLRIISLNGIDPDNPLCNIK